jgi:hypothetical protein
MGYTANAHLRTKKWEKGFDEGKGLDDVGLTPEIITWLEKGSVDISSTNSRRHAAVGSVQTNKSMHFYSCH